jgi:hypothetical protein
MSRRSFVDAVSTRRLVRHNDRLHDNFLLGHLSLWDAPAIRKM